MRIISKRTLREFWNLYPDVENQLLGWYKVMETGSFFHSNDILESFPYSRSIGSGRYVFNIKGNQYRLIVKINFDLQSVWVRFVGTHLQYDKIDALTI
ncbi:MAG: type II toxin-antitoxin system HigB family toxin [Saprospiraceae bacterium]|nr:type II toxin-antitoxin system HigB family toxin [Saprospiraceae bacterium]